MAPKTRQPRKRRITLAYIAAAVILVLVAGVGYYVLSSGSQQTTGTKPIILYVNQGNGVVNGSNFGALTSFTTSHGFNTIFFQVYRQGVLLFSPAQLATLVNESHSSGLKIFFALYITNSSQALPASIYGVGEDGINLDMSTLPLTEQQSLLANLQSGYHGQVAVTTTDMSSPLRPNLLILETYGTGLQQYIRHGTVASVGVFTTSSEQDYKSQFQFALQNSDGVMVFDYAGLLKRGY
jgi:hypothetical protein